MRKEMLNRFNTAHLNGFSNELKLNDSELIDLFQYGSPKWLFQPKFSYLSPKLEELFQYGSPKWLFQPPDNQ